MERRSALGGVAPGPSVWRGRLSRLGVQDAQRRLRISLSIAFGLTDSAGARVGGERECRAIWHASRRSHPVGSALGAARPARLCGSMAMG